MAKIAIETDYGPINFNIKGDTPSVSEKLRIDKILRSPKDFLPEDIIQSANQKKSGLNPSFDYTTGIKDGGLRAALSAAENSEEEETILSKFGIGQGDFIRDARGQLALTPSAASKFGVESDKNVVIDESGLSWGDAADLAGIVPELVGGIGGAITGQLAIPIPVIGAAIGAAIGAGGGSLVEEGAELAAGTSRQTAGEIAKDALKEAAWAGGGEGVIGGLFKAFGAVAKGSSVSSKMAPDQIITGGESIEMGVTPALGLIGANPLVSRAQVISEKIFKTSPRLKQNHDTILKKLDEYRSAAGAADADQLGVLLANAAQDGNMTLINASKNAKSALVQHMDDLASQLGKAADADANVDMDLLNAIQSTFKIFDDESKALFASVDSLVATPAGNAAILPTKALKKQAEDILKGYRGSAAGADTTPIINVLRAVRNLGDKASFTQVYNSRKSIVDLLSENSGNLTLRRFTNDFRNQMDTLLSPAMIDEMPSMAFRGAGPGTKKSLLEASKTLREARGFYKDGMKAYEGLEQSSILKDIASASRSGADLNAAGMVGRVVKPNNPELLRRVRDVLGDAEYQPLRERMAGQWLKDALESSGSATKPEKFRGSVFKQELDKLGSTAEQLFGENAGQVRELAKQLDALSLSNVNQSVIDDLISAAGPDAPAVGLLRNVANAQRELQDFTRSTVMKKLASGNLTEVEAAELIANSATKPADIDTLMKYFANSDEGISKIRGYYMENVIGDFGSNFMTEPKSFKAFGLRLEQEYKKGKLEKIFGRRMAEDMNKFGRVLVFNSKTVDGGDLIAANIAASPFQNLGKLARFTVLGRLASSDLFYKNFMKQYKGMTAGAGADEKSKAFGQLMAQFISSSISQGSVQLIDNAVGETIKEGTALFNNMTSAPPRAPMEAPVVMPSSVPEQIAPSLNREPKPWSGQWPESNMAPQSARERAAQNPVLAASLLGGLGSASLLNSQ